MEANNCVSAIRSARHFIDMSDHHADGGMMLKCPASRRHGCIWLMGALLVSRLLIRSACIARTNTLQFRVGRVGGITITFVFFLTAACAL